MTEQQQKGQPQEPAGQVVPFLGVQPAPGQLAPWDTEAGAGPAANGSGPVTGQDGRPLVRVNRDQGGLIHEARRALVAVNQPPQLFRKGGALSRIGFDDKNRAVIIPLSAQAIRAVLADKIGWRKAVAGSDGKPKVTPAGPPGIVVDDLFTRADELTSIPVLNQIVTAPVYAPDGALITTPGYAPAARTWYEPVDGMTLPRPVNPEPSWDEVAGAARFLMIDYLEDFPFDSEASRQHALAMLLLPFARLMIDGPVPLQCVDASTPGTGKGLLQRALMYPALGGMLPARPPALHNEDELKKVLTGALMAGNQVIRWDNVPAGQTVESAHLSMALTEPVWEDRLLGVNKDVKVPIQAIFMMTGNNMTFSQEMARRVLPVRLDLTRQAGSLRYAEEPWTRTGFRHPDLMAWAAQNRGELVWSALTLIQGWIAAGKPPGARSIGSYEKWAAVIGGIIEHTAGRPEWSQFLTGLDSLHADAVSERDERVAFLEAWYGWAGEAPVTTGQIITALGYVDPFGITGQGTLRSQETRLGVQLGKIRDQVCEGYQVVKKSRAWCVRRVS